MYFAIVYVRTDFGFSVHVTCCSNNTLQTEKNESTKAKLDKYGQRNVGKYGVTAN